MIESLIFEMYEITDEYALDEYVPGRFSGVIKGFPMVLDVNEASSEDQISCVELKMNVTLKKESERTEFAERIFGMFSDSGFEDDLIIDAHKIGIKMYSRERLKEDIKILLEVLPNYFISNQYRSGCGRCGVNRNVSFTQPKWEQAEFLCSDCKDIAVKESESRLQRHTENAIANKKKIKKASASFWIGATGHSIIPAVILSLSATLLVSLLMGFYFSQDAYAVIVGLLPEEITGFNLAQRSKYQLDGMGFSSIWRALGGIAPVVGIGVFRATYRILCRKGMLLYILGHLVLHFSVLIIGIITQYNKVINTIDFGVFPVNVALADLPNRFGLHILISAIPLAIIYVPFFLLVWKNID